MEDQQYTLTQAVHLVSSIGDDDKQFLYSLGIFDDAIALTPEEMNRTSALWCWLTGAEDMGERAVKAAIKDLKGALDIVVMLNLPAIEFLDWWRVQDDWAFFGLTKAAGGHEAWAWTVVDRVRLFVEAVGVEAHRVPVSRV